MPSAQSVPLRRARAESRAAAAAAAAGSPQRTAASTSSGSAYPVSITSSASQTRRAASSARSCRPSPFCSTALAYSASVIALPSPRAVASRRAWSISASVSASSPRHAASASGA